MAERRSKPVAEAAAEAARVAEPGRRTRRARPAGRASDVFGGELRRRDVFPLLVLHLVARRPAYGNRLIEEIEEITGGTISVNPNTMYPLLRELEADGKIEGRWEHPDRRTRRFYEITAAGRQEYERLRAELEPFLEAMARTIELIRSEIYE
jgi:PadR family transcriptional regulator, regulatory protein PadR